MQKYKNAILTTISIVIIVFLIMILVFLLKNYCFNSKNTKDNTLVKEEISSLDKPKDFSILSSDENAKSKETTNINSENSQSNVLENSKNSNINNDNNNNNSVINSNANNNSNSNTGNVINSDTSVSNNQDSQSKGTTSNQANSSSSTTKKSTSSSKSTSSGSTVVTKKKKLPFDTSIKSAPNGESYSEIAYLDISSLKIKYPVISTTSTELLKLSITKFWGSNPNEVGNCCIIGHNYHTSKFFSNLQKIKVGDTFTLTDKNGRTFKYKVYDTYYVVPEDTSCTSQLTNGRIDVTLITCSNDGKKRFIVKATKIN